MTCATIQPPRITIGRTERNRACRPGPHHVFVIGLPGDVGGANTECWHTVRLWRQFGLGVSVIPTWETNEKWSARLEAAGCRVVPTSPHRLPAVPGVAGSLVVSFCNSRFLRHADVLRDLGCRIVWVNCMTWLFAEERKHYRRRGPFDAYVFQSRCQQAELQPQLGRYGVRPEQCHRIRGAFDCNDFPFCPLPHKPHEPLVIGRISRAAPDKFAADTWSVYGRARHPIRARVMGWDRRVEEKLGRPPVWAECLAAGAEPSAQFFRSIHCMVQLNGSAEENWPRSGLEAMAAGVPVVAENRWGWREMIRPGETGFLCNGPGEIAETVDRLAADESLRLAVARRARQVLVNELADPQTIWSGWRRLFEELELESLG
jgi:hypothetical protein